MKTETKVKFVLFFLLLGGVTWFLVSTYQRREAEKAAARAEIEASVRAYEQRKEKEKKGVLMYDRYCSDLRSYGAADAFVRPGTKILTYVVRKGELSTNGYSVAKTMYEDAIASGCYGLEGCDVLELPDSTCVGQYRK